MFLLEKRIRLEKAFPEIDTTKLISVLDSRGIIHFIEMLILEEYEKPGSDEFDRERQVTLLKTIIRELDLIENTTRESKDDNSGESESDEQVDSIYEEIRDLFKDDTAADSGDAADAGESKADQNSRKFPTELFKQILTKTKEMKEEILENKIANFMVDLDQIILKENECQEYLRKIKQILKTIIPKVESIKNKGAKKDALEIITRITFPIYEKIKEICNLKMRCNSILRLEQKLQGIEALMDNFYTAEENALDSDSKTDSDPTKSCVNIIGKLKDLFVRLKEICRITADANENDRIEEMFGLFREIKIYLDSIELIKKILFLNSKNSNSKGQEKIKRKKTENENETYLKFFGLKNDKEEPNMKNCIKMYCTYYDNNKNEILFNGKRSFTFEKEKLDEAFETLKGNKLSKKGNKLSKKGNKLSKKGNKLSEIYELIEKSIIKRRISYLGVIIHKIIKFCKNSTQIHKDTQTTFNNRMVGAFIQIKNELNLLTKEKFL